MSVAYQPPRVRDDGTCAVCLKVRPEVAVKAGDPFCSTACARADYSGTSAPPAAPPSAAAVTPNGTAPWTRETIIAAVQQWAAEHDAQPPRTTDWAKSSDPRWPNTSTVIKYFKKWRAAIEAAGFDPSYWSTRAAAEAQRRPRSVAVVPVPPPPPPAAVVLRDPIRTADIPYDAEVLADEARFLRERADALDQIAGGIRRLAELAA